MAVGLTAAVVLAAAVLLRAGSAVAWPLFALAALYAATLRGALDGRSVVYAAGMLLAAELAFFGIEHEPLVREEREVVLRRVAAAAGALAASALAGLLVLVVAGVDVGAGLPLAAVGAAAAVGLLLLVARLARATSS